MKHILFLYQPLEQTLKAFLKAKIFIFSVKGEGSLSAMSYLKREGYTNDIYVMKGGITQTIKEGYPLVKK